MTTRSCISRTFFLITAQTVRHLFSGGRDERIQATSSKIFREICAFFRAISWIVFPHRSYQPAIAAPVSPQEKKPKAKTLTVYDVVNSVPEIPDCLYDDEIFSRFICPITQRPIRFIIFEPNKKIFYEKAAIEQWLDQCPISPITRQPLRKEDLVPAPAVQCFISYWLAQHIKLTPKKEEKP